MSQKRRKRRFSNNQLVVFRYSNRKLVGRVCNVKPVAKTFIYDVACEDGKIYHDLVVDAAMNSSIDTYLTKLFYLKYDIDEADIPEHIEDEPRFKSKSVATEENDEEDLVQTLSYDDEGVLYDLNDSEAE